MTANRMFVFLNLWFILAILLMNSSPASSFSVSPQQPETAATTLTINGSPDDGELMKINCTDWAACRSAITGTNAWKSSTYGTVQSVYEWGYYHNKRSIFFFDTAKIPANAQITTATLHVYAGPYQKGSTKVHVVSSQASRPLTTADYSRIKFTSGGSAAPSSNSWMEISLNAAALSWIAKGGMTQMALIHDYDLNNKPPTESNSISVDFAESSLHPPYLVVTYGVSSSNTIVAEARKDIGMPYDANRGCPSPYTGCGGPYHGFYNGVCTDLALDAYSAGAAFNIQNALKQDQIAHPGRYRYASARNAEDMRRYFSYNGLFLAHDQPYQTGDIAFFDWDGDGLTNHVLVISEVNASNRPLKMVDASGVIPNINHTGNAFEHAWSTYYEQRVQGHARLVPGILPQSAGFAETLQILRVSVNAATVDITLFDQNGKSISQEYDENLVANNIESSIPYIPGGSYTSSVSGKVITVTQPLANTSQYFLRINGQASTPYTLLIETLQDNLVTATRSYTQSIATGETQNTTITVSESGGVIGLLTQSPVAAPVVSLPEALTVTGKVDTTAHLVFHVAETGGQLAVSSASISAANLVTPYGIPLPPGKLTISPASFNLAPGGDQPIDIQVDLAGLYPGQYMGSLIFSAPNANPRMIPFTLRVEYHPLYLPSAQKN